MFSLVMICFLLYKGVLIIILCTNFLLPLVVIHSPEILQLLGSTVMEENYDKVLDLYNTQRWEI